VHPIGFSDRVARRMDRDVAANWFHGRRGVLARESKVQAARCSCGGNPRGGRT